MVEVTCFICGTKLQRKPYALSPRSVCSKPLCKFRFNSIKNSGENNHFWVGDKVGYSGRHKRIKKIFSKPELCQRCCLVPPKDLANISQEYKLDITDWEWLCRKCHMLKDGRLLKNLRQFQSK